MDHKLNNPHFLIFLFIFSKYQKVPSLYSILLTITLLCIYHNLFNLQTSQKRDWFKDRISVFQVKKRTIEGNTYRRNIRIIRRKHYIKEEKPIMVRGSRSTNNGRTKQIYSILINSNIYTFYIKTKIALVEDQGKTIQKMKMFWLCSYREDLSREYSIRAEHFSTNLFSSAKTNWKPWLNN